MFYRIFINIVCILFLWLPATVFSHSDEHLLVILVNARHLDYSCPQKLFKTIAKHPSDCSKNGDVGHAWIYLEGCINGERVYVEGGHSGELGIIQPKYFDGVMNCIEYGYANPTPEQMCCPRYEPNPIKYLWSTLYDGFFQWGSGGHMPTYAAKVVITPLQFQEILRFLDEKNYNYQNYTLTGNQCSTFVVEAAAIAGLELACDVTMPIDQEIILCGEKLRLWEDPSYSQITFSSPDVIECSLKKAVREERAEYALEWYKRTHPKSFKQKLGETTQDVIRFPSRIKRAARFS